MTTFACPRCGAVSHHPDDARYGYCGRCHDYTGQHADPVTRLLVVVARDRHDAEQVIERTLDARYTAELGIAADIDPNGYSVGRSYNELTARGIRTVGVRVVTIDDARRLAGANLRPDDVIVLDHVDGHVLDHVLNRVRIPTTERGLQPPGRIDR